MLALSLLALTVGALAAPAVDLTSRQEAGGCTINYNGTSISGLEANGTCRYTIRYGTAERWGYSTAAINQDGQNAAEFPPKCPQDDAVMPTSNQSEDCLYAVVYTPANISAEAKLPVLLYIHGGSFIIGSASEPGMEGTGLAHDGNMIVVFIQYRLGILGFLPPSNAPTSNDPNLGTRDAILALETVRSNIGAFGGDPTKVTIGGQSAGAALSRVLLGAPAAKGLYRGVIMQSDPNNYGAQQAAQRDGLQKMTFGNESMSNCTDFDCFKGVPVKTILAVQSSVNKEAPGKVPGVSAGLVFRPQAGTETIPTETCNLLLNDPAGLSIDVPNVSLLITTVRNETGFNVQSIFSKPTPAAESLYELALKTLLGDERGKIVMESGLYPLSDDTDGMRTTIDRVATDAAFRCVNRELARRYAGAGGKVWVGEWEKGVSYLQNRVGYCAEDTAVCHSDDLYPTFGTTPAEFDTAETMALETQVRKVWVSFVTNGTPSPEGIDWAGWTPNSTDTDVFPIGGGDVATCPADFWGVKVKWDFQLWSNTSDSSGANGTATSVNGASESVPAGQPASGAKSLGGSVVLVVASTVVSVMLYA